MLNKSTYPPIICPLCNEFRPSFDKCERPDCDFEEYRNAIWDYFEKAPPPKYYITLTGGVNAGKTYYLISLIYDLLFNRSTIELLRAKGISKAMMIDPISDGYFRSFIEQAKYGRLELTISSKKLSFFSIFVFDKRGNATELVFFNTSGEKIEDTLAARNFRTKSHELKGAAILHFVDPREDSLLNELLENPKDLSFGPCKDFNIVEYMHQLMQYEHRGITAINNPIAICVSKFDLLMHRIPYDLPESLNLDPLAENYFKDIKEKSTALADFLNEYSTTVSPDDLRDKYNRLEYFAIAPYGSDNEAVWDKRNPQGILDPFLWILKQLRILPEY